MGDSIYKPGYGPNSVAQFQMGPSSNLHPSQMLTSSPDQQHNGVQPRHPVAMGFHYAGNPSVQPGNQDMMTGMASMGLGQMPNNQTELNLSANEFYPKTGASMLHHSASAPSFENLAGISKPMYPLLDNVHSSPVLTPSGSPQLTHRRVNSQLSPPRLNMNPLVTLTPRQQLEQQQQDLVQENFGGTTYFYNKDEYVSPTTRQILKLRHRINEFSAFKIRKILPKTFPNYSMYTGVPPHIAHTKPNTSSEAFFMRDEIKQDLLRRQAVLLSEVEGVTDIPAEVDNYCNLVPLEITGKNQPSRKIGCPCTVYKAVNQKDGMTYCLHRIHGFKLTNKKVTQIIDRWKKISSPHIVTLREVFTTKSFNDNSIVFVYDYHPTAETLEMKFFSNPLAANGYSNPFSLDGSARPYSAGKGTKKPGDPSSEANIWSYIIQLSGALRVIHTANLSARSILPSKVIVMDKNRLRLNCVCILDILQFESAEPTASTITRHQQEDLHSLGRLVLALACNSQLALLTENINSSLELIQTHCSKDLNRVIRMLLFPTQTPQGPFNVNHIMPLIGARFYTELESADNKIECLEHEMTKECENGRLFRIQAKLNTILERPEFSGDAQWSETGDRYLLKLFRDYVFHQTTETGAPWIDMAHIVSCLNKLDAGISEKVCLSSGDETSVIIVSYQELRRCFEAAYSELIQANALSYSQ